MSSIRTERLVKDVHPIKKMMANETSVMSAFTAGVAVSCATCLFSLNFPFLLQPKAAAEVYLPAFYEYNASLSLFDNSAWTYMTDYMLTIVMTRMVFLLMAAKSTAVILKRRACSLLVCYAISVTAGGIAHQFFTTAESRNTLTFRILWTVCVGTVTAAGGFMGACASEVSDSFGFYRIPGWFWAGFAWFTTILCVGGVMSFQRPAADIFVAGITQLTPTTAMVIPVLQLFSQGRIPGIFTLVCVLGFVLHAPLLPLYSFLLFHASWTLPAVNALLHCWLCVTWAVQGFSLLYFIRLTGGGKKV